MNKMIVANLIHRPLRSLISIVAIALEVTLILLVVGLLLGILNDSKQRQIGIGADVMVHMCQYLSGTELCEEFAESCMGHLELARLGAKAKVKTLVISHVTEQIDQPGVRERVIREMAEIYPGNIVFGADLMEIPVSGPAAAKLQ